MASLLKVDALTGVTTAGSISVTGEGGSTTTNLQQGLAKSYLTYDQTVPEVDGSFNVASVTDNSAGNWDVNYTSNMNNTTYSWFTGGQDSRFAGVNTGTVPTTSTIRYYTRITNTLALADVNLNTAGIHGDLA
jgi:hypothetical protein